MPMTIIKPLEITDAMVTSTDVPETDYPDWDAGATYSDASSDGTIVQRAHHVYALQVASSQGDDPLTRPDVWKEVGTTNAYKMFDPLNPVGDPTRNPSKIEVTVEPGQLINGLALLGLSGAVVDVSISDGSNGVVYSKSFDLTTRVVANWYDHWWAPFSIETQVVIFDLPPMLQPVISVTITGTGSDVECGKMLIGTQVTLGCTMYGVKGRRRDTSIVELTELGERRLVRRRTVRTRSYTLRIPSHNLDYVDRQLGDLYGLPTFFSGSDRWAFSNLYGILRDSEPTLTNAQTSYVSLKVEEI